MIPWIMSIIVSADLPATAEHAERFESMKSAASRAVSDKPWWTLFDDPDLVRVVENALDNNYDLRQSAARILFAEAQSVRALSPLLPRVSADATGNVAPFGSLGFQFGGGLGGGGDTPSVFYTGSALLNARWQLDLWGRSLLAYQAARLERSATEGDREAIALTLSSEVGNAYFDVVFNRQAIALVDEQIQANARLLELLEVRFERGESTGLDVLQQRQQYAARAAELPPLRSQLRIAEQRLAVLSGTPTRQTSPKTAEVLPPPPRQPGLGTPADLLANRPDLRAAAKRSRSNAKRASSAARVHLPTLTLNGNGGWQFFRGGRATALPPGPTTPPDGATTQPDQSPTPRGRTQIQSVWGASATLSLPLFNGFGDVAEAREARANASEAADLLNQSFLDAVGEVENAVVTETETLEQLQRLEDQTEAAQLALKESEARYIAGLADYIAVLTALTAAQTAERSELQARRSILTARLQLYAALGGPWTDESLNSSGDIQ